MSLEKYRKQQYYIGIVVLLLAIFSVVQSIHFNIQDRRQKECLEDVIRDLTASINTRVEIANLDSQNKTRVIRAVASANAENRPRAVFKALQEFVIEDDRIAELRKKNPVPPLPEGTCDQK